jgi:hypothetical protein
MALVRISRESWSRAALGVLELGLEVVVSGLGPRQQAGEVVNLDVPREEVVQGVHGLVGGQARLVVHVGLLSGVGEHPGAG